MERKERSVFTIGAAVTALALSAVLVWGKKVSVAAIQEKSPKAPWSVRYHDGSGNGYRLWESGNTVSAHYEYAPIQPENSSSGIYSGGKPQKGTLTVKRVRELWQRLRKLEKDTSLHINDRMMVTGSFVLKEAGGEERKFLIKSGAALREFDSFMEPLRKGSGKK